MFWSPSARQRGYYDARFIGIPTSKREFGYVADTRKDGRCAIAYVRYIEAGGGWTERFAGKACGVGKSKRVFWTSAAAKKAHIHVRLSRKK